MSSIAAMSASVATRPERMSVTKIITSAASMANCACARICERITSLALGSIPPVSTKENLRPSHSQSP